jgi:hypothetical protein
VSLMEFFSKRRTLKTAGDASQCVGGKEAGRFDRSMLMTGPCIVGAIKSTHLLGKPTPWMKAHEFWHSLSKDQVRD